MYLVDNSTQYSVADIHSLQLAIWHAREINVAIEEDRPFSLVPVMFNTWNIPPYDTHNNAS